MRYRDAGVDVTRADAVKHGIGDAVRATWTPGVRALPAGFAGVMAIPGAAAGAPLLAATMDGVGTKLHVALAAGRVADAAADLVYHGANDLLVHGARPFALLDYVAQSRLDPETVAAVVAGLARACREVGAVLLGGETAEMPDTYLEGVVDVAGCMLGVVDPARVIDGAAVRPGDVVLGLGSAGLHTNGFSLARRVVAASGAALGDRLPGTTETIGEALLAPHRWYGPALEPLLASGDVHALAHVTGGGIAGNLVRVLPEGAQAVVRAGAWQPPPLFRWLIERGGIPEDDARTSLNLGIGMVVVCGADRAPALARELLARGERVETIGVVQSGPRGVVWET
jgi:phosphoribosylformylglycinamidine cyclo-ligase